MSGTKIDTDFIISSFYIYGKIIINSIRNEYIYFNNKFTVWIILGVGYWYSVVYDMWHWMRLKQEIEYSIYNELNWKMQTSMMFILTCHRFAFSYELRSKPSGHTFKNIEKAKHL